MKGGLLRGGGPPVRFKKKRSLGLVEGGGETRVKKKG